MHSSEGVVEKATSSSDRSSSIESQSAVGDAPNGGALAWLQVLGAFFLWFNTW